MMSWQIIQQAKAEAALSVLENATNGNSYYIKFLSVKFHKNLQP